MGVLIAAKVPARKLRLFINTKTQLRGFHQKMINKAFEEKIKEIIQNVIRYANNNETSYTEITHS